MLLSHRHGFLFVHIAKTGGSSIRAALARMMWTDPLAWPQWVCHRLSHLTGHRIGTKLPRHAGIAAAEFVLPQPYYHWLWKFAIVRNPWDRLVSAYGHYQRECPYVLEQQQVGSFHQFVPWILCNDTYTGPKPDLRHAIRRTQFHYLVNLDGDLQTQFLGSFENLEHDFGVACQSLGFPPLKLPSRRRRRLDSDYRSCYNDRCAEEVMNFYTNDITLLGYSFDRPGQPGQGPWKGGSQQSTSNTQQRRKRQVA